MLRNFTKIGLFLLSLSMFVSAQPATGPKTLSICKILENTQSDGKTHTVSAVLSRRSDASLFLYSPKCNNGDYFASLDFSRFRDLPFLNSKHTAYDVRFLAKASTSLFGAYGTFGAFRAEFLVLKILSVKPAAAGIAPPDLEAETPILDSGNSLREQNVTLMFSILKDRYIPHPWYELVDENAKFILNGKVIDRDAITDMFTGIKSGTFSVGARVIESSNEKWIVKGLFAYEPERGRKRVFSFQNEYVRGVGNYTRKLSQMELREN